jgi:hypothetical protein
MILRHKMALKSALAGLGEALQQVKEQAVGLGCVVKSHGQDDPLVLALKVDKFLCTAAYPS